MKTAFITGEVTGLGVIRLLEAMRLTVPEACFYQASSSPTPVRATSEART